MTVTFSDRTGMLWQGKVHIAPTMRSQITRAFRRQSAQIVPLRT